MIVHVMQGLPASGKTTLARELVRDSDGHIRRVNLDDLRRMSDGDSKSVPWTPERERVITAVQNRVASAYLMYGHDVVVDNTHLYPGQLLELREAMNRLSVEWQVHSLMDVSMGTCIARNALRADGERVPFEAFVRLDKKFLEAELLEGWTLTASWLEGSS